MGFWQRVLFVCFMGFVFASFLAPAYALDLKIFSLKDGFVTFDDLVMLKGQVSGSKDLKVNNTIVDVAKDGSFKTALILNPGKNYVEVVASGKGGKSIKRSFRIVRLVTFPDVEEIIDAQGHKHWARDNVIKLATLGLIEAYPDNNFYLKRPVSRGEFATWLCRTKKLPTFAVSGEVFYDVPGEHWRAPYIKAVVDQGYMGSFANNLFWVDDGILRGEAAEVIVKAEGGARTGEAEAVFTDIPLNHPYAFWISEAFRKHLLYGMSDQKRLYDPDRFMTRAEAAMLFGRDPKVEEEMYLLLDMNKGFGEKAFCPINSAPLVTQVKADPSTVYVGEQKVVVLTAVVIDRQGLEDLSNVTVDLTGIGGPPDATMFDDATNGDEEKNNGIFSLRILVNPTKTGDIFFKVRAVDRYTFEGFGETKIMVLE